MNECELCGAPTRNRKRTGKRQELLCTEHREATEYYDRLTPAELTEHYRMAAAYVDEAEQEGI